MLKNLIRSNRSYRRFHQDTPINIDTLKELVDLARLSATGGNKQPLKFFIVCDPNLNDKIFPLLTWAGALPDWPGPGEGAPHQGNPRRYLRNAGGSGYREDRRDAGF